MQARAKISLEHLGKTRAPLVVIENGTSALDKLRDLAINSAEFTPDNLTMYPGLRAPLPKEWVIDYLKPLLPYLYKIFKIPQNLNPSPRYSYFSVVTLDESELKPVQTLPHFDTNNPFLISIIHYLNKGTYGGTGFFRHKKTQFEYVNHSRREEYLKSVESYLLDNIHISPSYCNEFHPEYEMYNSIDYAEDKMIIFQGYMLHSALINTATDICDSPETGRLTANLFIEFN